MDIVQLNIGGVLFYTTRTTLNLCPSILKTMVNASPEKTDFFVDRDPMLFRYVLNWIRGTHCLPSDPDMREELWYEADYYGLEEMSIRLSPG